MSNKEVASTTRSGTSVAVTIQTATSVLEGATPDGTKALTKDVPELRKYLAAHTNEAYIAADVSSASIAAALAATRENGLKLYQSYALGVTPTDSVKPVAVPKDELATGITLYIPALVGADPSGDYKITYKVGNATPTATPDVTIPLPAAGTGSSTDVKILFE